MTAVYPYNPIKGSPNANPILAGNTKTPQQLNMAIVNRQHQIDAFDDRFAIAFEDFADQGTFLTGTQMGDKILTTAGTAGTVTNSQSKMTLAAAGGLTWNGYIQPRCKPCAPYVYVQARVSAYSNIDVHIGLLKDAGNYALAYVDHIDNKIKCAVQIAGVGVASGASNFVVSGSTPFTLTAVISWPCLYVFADMGDGDFPVCYADLESGTPTTNQTLLKIPTNLATWKPSIGGGMLSTGSVSFSWVKVGYTGALGTRDYGWITYPDGTPYQEDGKLWFTGTKANSNGQHGNCMAVFSLDPVTYRARLESHIFYAVSSTNPTSPTAVKDRITSLYGGQCIYDPTLDRFSIITNGWGYQDPGDGVQGIQPWFAQTTANILRGVHVLDAFQMTWPTNGGTLTENWDHNYRQMSDGTWRLVCTEFNWDSGGTLSANRVPNVFTSPDLVNGGTWTRVATASGGGGIGHDGTRQIKVGNIWYVTSSNSGSSAGHYTLWDDSVVFQSNTLQWDTAVADAPMMTIFPPHACVCGYGEENHTRYLMLTYGADSLAPSSGSTINATVGTLYVLEAAEQPAGNENPYQRLPRPGR